MVLVTVRQDKGAHVFLVLDQEGEVGDDHIHTQKFRIREHHARVNNKNVFPIADGHAIHTEFAESAERNDLQFLTGHEDNLLG